MTVPIDTWPPVPSCLPITEEPSAAISAHGKADPLHARDFGEERVVAAGGLRAALDHVTGHHGARQRVPVGAAPAVAPGRRAADDRGVGDSGR